METLRKMTVKAVDSYEFITRNGRDFFNVIGEIEEARAPRELSNIRIRISLNTFKELKKASALRETSSTAVIREIVCGALFVEEEDIERSNFNYRNGVASFYFDFGGNVSFSQSDVDECLGSVQITLREYLKGSGE